MIQVSQEFKQKLKFRTDYLKHFECFSNNSKLMYLYDKLEKILFLDTVEQKDINSIKRLLRELSDTSNATQQAEGISLETNLYALLLLFVELKPLNDDCTIYWGPIEDNQRIYLSNGYQFNIEPLIEYFLKQRKFIDMFSNELLCYRDISLILSFPSASTRQLIPFMPSDLNSETIDQFHLELTTLLIAESEALQLHQWQATKSVPTANPMIEMSGIIGQPYLAGNIVVVEVEEQSADEDSLCQKIGCTIS